MNSIAVALENAKLVALTSSRRVRGVLARSRRPCYGSEKHLHRYLAPSSIFATQTVLRLASAIRNARALLSVARRDGVRSSRALFRASQPLRAGLHCAHLTPA